jgi:hypothetical protein
LAAILNIVSAILGSRLEGERERERERERKEAFISLSGSPACDSATKRETESSVTNEPKWQPRSLDKNNRFPIEIQ